MNNFNLGSDRNNRYDEARDGLDTVHQISNLLKCKLDKNSLRIIISLIENGVKPECVAALVDEIRRRSNTIE